MVVKTEEEGVDAIRKVEGVVLLDGFGVIDELDNDGIPDMAVVE